jgi:hypothetical protein
MYRIPRLWAKAQVKAVKMTMGRIKKASSIQFLAGYRLIRIRARTSRIKVGTGVLNKNTRRK